MSRAIAGAFFFLLILSLPLVCSAQLKSADNYTVSVHQLSIPDKAMAAYNRGIHLLAAQDQAGSIPEFRRAIKAFPAYYEAYDKMGIAELELKRDTEAEAAFRKAIELSGGRYAEPHFALGVILCDDEKQFAEAEATIRSGIELDPSDAAGHFSLGWVQYSTGRLTDAEESAREALIYAPNSPVNHVLLAEIHMRQKNRRALIEDLETYLRLEPNGSFSAKAKALLADTQRALSLDAANLPAAMRQP